MIRGMARVCHGTEKLEAPPQFPAVTMVGTTLLCLFLVPRVLDAEMPERSYPAAPVGYGSRVAVMAAIATGQLELIDPEKPVEGAIREERDIEYSRIGERSLKLDLALPVDPPAPVPGVLFIHGGSWSGGSRDVYHYYTKRFAARGYAAATMSYRLSGEAVFPAAVHDAKNAVRWLRANADKYRIDPDRLAVVGGSAGGHLALMVGYTANQAQLEGEGDGTEISSHVSAVVDFYGPVDLTTEKGQSSDVVRRFLGASYEDAPETFRLASPLFHLQAGAPPTLVIHGTLDQIVSVNQSDRLVERLQALEIPHHYERLEGWPHTLDAAKVVNDHCQEVMFRFLEQHLSRDKPNE